MNQTFNLNRFSMLFIKHTVEHYKTYLMSFFVLLGVLFFAMGFVAYVSEGVISENLQIPFFIFGLLISGTIFTSIVFADLGNKRKAIAALTLPASHFEKYLVAWIYSFIIFQIFFVPSFYLVVMLINQLAQTRQGELDPKLLDLLSEDSKVYIVFLVYAVFHSVTLLGSIFFQKYQFIKTAFTLFIGVFILTLLNTQLIKVLLNNRKVDSAIPFAQVNTHNEYDIYQRIILPEEKGQFIIFWFMVIVAILWACTFYRLKEKEV